MLHSLHLLIVSALTWLVWDHFSFISMSGFVKLWSGGRWRPGLKRVVLSCQKVFSSGLKDLQIFQSYNWSSLKIWFNGWPEHQLVEPAKGQNSLWNIWTSSIPLIHNSSVNELDINRWASSVHSCATQVQFTPQAHPGEWSNLLVRFCISQTSQLNHTAVLLQSTAAQSHYPTINLQMERIQFTVFDLSKENCVKRWLLRTCWNLFLSCCCLRSSVLA